VELRLRETGALGRDGGLQADRVAAQCVQLALHQQKGAVFPDPLAGLVEAEEELSLAEERRLGRVDVLGIAGGVLRRRDARQLAAGKGNCSAVEVPDGDHQAPLKARPGQGAAVGRIKESGLPDAFRRKYFSEPVEQLARVIRRREANAVLPGQLRRKAALLHPVPPHPLRQRRGGLPALDEKRPGGFLDLQKRSGVILR